MSKNGWGRRAALGFAVMVSAMGGAACEDEVATMSLARFEVAQAEALCDNLVRCDHTFGDAKAIAAYAKAAPDACPGWAVEMFRRDPGSPVVLAAAGRATFVADRAKGCLEAIEGSCAVDPSMVPECRAVFVGASPQGGACESSAECAAGLECDRSDTCGRCEPASSVAVVEVGLGESCGYVQGVGTLRMCGEGLYCAQSEVCEAKLADGEACTRNEQCRGSSVCLSELGLGEGCGAIPVRELGESCSNDEGSGSGLCNRVKGLACDDGTCVQLGDGSLGSVCVRTDEAPCDLGFYCDPASGRCADLEPAGASCELDRDCESGTCDYGAEAPTCSATCG